MSVFRKEYIKHMKNALFPYFFGGIAFCVGLFLPVLIVTNVLIYPRKENIDYIQCRYDDVVKSEVIYDDLYGEYGFPELITLYTSNEDRINVNVYMSQSGDFIALSDYTKSLNSDEIIVSDKVATRFKLNVGDSVFLEFPNLLERKEYTVVSIAPYCWNYYDLSSNADFSVVHIGYDETVERNMNTDMVYFLSGSEYSQFVADNRAYIKHYDVCNELKLLRKQMDTIGYSYFAFISVVSLFYLLAISRIIRKEVIKYFHNGFVPSICKRIYRLDLLLLFIVPIVLFGVIAFSFISKSNSYRYIYIPLLIDLIFCFLSYMKGGRAYEQVA